VEISAHSAKLRLHQKAAAGILPAPLDSQTPQYNSSERTMFHKPGSGLAGIALLLYCAAVAPAQDFCVSTRIYDARESDGAGKGKNAAPSKLLGRSTSLFHAGKVYDYGDSGRQMTVFEPAHERFVIIDESRRQLIVVPFEYIENRLFRASSKTKQKIEELRRQGTADAKKLADLLEFELSPKFTEKYDARNRRLTMSSPFLSYDVECATHDSAELLQGYLNYTYWAQRMNYLLNARAIFPGPRLELNAALRRRTVLPTKVTLHTRQRDGLHLRAEHQFHWNLDATDRNQITHWEKLMTAGDMKEVSPEDAFEPDAGDKTVDRR
jgi:hypothetical protein